MHDYKYCPYCRCHPLNPEWNYCPYCGWQLAELKPPEVKIERG